MTCRFAASALLTLAAQLAAVGINLGLQLRARAASPNEQQLPVTVGPGGANFTSIQAAIDAASTGQTIEVRSGTYRENVRIKKQLALRAVDTGGGKPIVDAAGRDSAVTLSADHITVEGFKVTNSGKKWGDAGILVNSKNNIIRKNTVVKNHTGIMFQRCSQNTVADNDVSDNHSDGICLIGAAGNTIKGNTANSNKRAGIWLESAKKRGPPEPADHNTLDGNTASNNAALGIALNTGADDNIVKDNRASGNREAGILLNCGPMRNTVSGNQVIKNVANGILLTASGPQNRIMANQVHENDNGIAVLSSSGNTFTSNQVSRNRSYGIRIGQMSPMHFVSTMCVLSQNNLIDNKINAYDISGKPWQPPANAPSINAEMLRMLSTPNQWDDGSKGNHYSDFTKPSEGCVDANQDGISDNPHPIPGGAAVDRFPLVAPIVPAAEKK